MHHHHKNGKIRSLITRNQPLLITTIFIIIVAVLAVVIFTYPRGPSRYVDVEVSGEWYNATSDELTFTLSFSPSDNNINLTRLVFPETDTKLARHLTCNIHLYVNGFLHEEIFCLSNYSIDFEIPISGTTTPIDLYFSDVQTNMNIIIEPIELTYP